MNFLATKISFNVNPESNPKTPTRRLPQSRPTPSDFKYTYDDEPPEYETLIEEAEDFDDHRPPSPVEPDGPDAEPEHLMLL